MENRTSPRDVADRCGTPVPGGHCTAPAAASDLVVEAAAGPYDRHRWEAAVLGSQMHRSTRLVALTLAHHAGEMGHIPAGDLQDPDVLAEATGLVTRHVRQALAHLGRYGWMRRPGPDTATRGRAAKRPITLTLPGARGELPSTGEVPE
ncbi:hypothetical protein [Streptomyces sp. SID13726]|uniref:hypothetical protein n=1 Tax=Streptomyces sp. SID13726 TaxID=2706058 RepID=UPI0013BB6556|nr:hypothetical protein [Streptomyces sp. SID13726]NEB00600.1 hypothetical protein [Streptomyces sp. SID13726]